MSIQVTNLTKVYGTQRAVDGISFSLKPGEIVGFLGPNGAGKTTTIKMLLNLLNPSAGSIRIFDMDLQSNRISILKQIGSLIEQPAIYHHLTGRENLLNRAMLLQVSEQRVDEMLNLVQLTAAAGKKAGNYSLGMKQRLGIALALLNDPKLLILDEPTNGLDPNGIIEIRELMMRIVKEGKTVFVSSHLLSEVEKMATHVGIINHGKMMFQGTISELQNINQPQIYIETSSSVDAANLLKRHHIAIGEIEEDHLLVPFTSKQQIGDINNLLVQNGITVFGINKQHKDLEKLFLDITKSN